MKYAIITGASRGLGEAIAMKLIHKGIAVISVSRTENEEIKELALQNSLYYKHYSCNLSSETAVQEVFMEISQSVFLMEPKEIYLFNNAGMIEPIHKVGNLEQTPLLQNIQVNLIAPIFITNLFFKNSTLAGTDVNVINITSGAADHPIEGWSVYCSAKAGLNMFTQTAALEQDELKTGNKVIAFSPGVMDTKMQETIRSSSKEDFSDVERFVEYKDTGKLLSADVVGGALVELVLSGDMENGKIYHISDLLKS